MENVKSIYRLVCKKYVRGRVWSSRVVSRYSADIPAQTVIQDTMLDCRFSEMYGDLQVSLILACADKVSNVDMCIVAREYKKRALKTCFTYELMRDVISVNDIEAFECDNP